MSGSSDSKDQSQGLEGRFNRLIFNKRFGRTRIEPKWSVTE